MAVPATRQWLSKRQSATVDALVEAGREALVEVGYDALSLRDVATRAGVTHTTAYSYFASKDHLVAELYRRLLEAAPAPKPDPGAPLSSRIADALRSASAPLSSEPELARASLGALVSQDPDTARIRDAIGADIARRIGDATGPDVDERIATAVLFMFTGAMLQAGLGYLSFDDVVERVAEAVSLWDGKTIRGSSRASRSRR